MHMHCLMQRLMFLSVCHQLVCTCLIRVQALHCNILQSCILRWKTCDKVFKDPECSSWQCASLACYCSAGNSDKSTTSMMIMVMIVVMIVKLTGASCTCDMVQDTTQHDHHFRQQAGAHVHVSLSFIHAGLLRQQKRTDHSISLTGVSFTHAACY